MKIESLNGRKIPYDLSLPELRQLLSAGEMADFTVACEALSQKADKESFEILFGYLDHRDPYKRRYALEAICHHSIKEKLDAVLTDKLSDNNIYVVKTALVMIYEQKIKVPKGSVVNAIRRNGLKLDAYDFNALSVVLTEKDFSECLSLLQTFKHKESVESVLTEILFNIAAEDTWRTLYDITQNSEKAQIRMKACKLLIKFNCMKELSNFINDKDGHIRKFAERNSL